MSALRNIKFNQEEDGELPSLVTGEEDNLQEILKNVSYDGGNIVSDAKVERVNKQVENVSNDMTNLLKRKRIPVSIITGYLGSGKSTLLEKIALKGADRKIAVILNEFGDSSEIEKAMTIKNGSSTYQEWLDLGNGCLCCSLKNVGVKAIEDMVERSPGKIDYILLETSGIADPAPIAKMFWQDEGLNSSVYIDGIITVLDCEHILKCLDDVSIDAHWHGDKVGLKGNLTIAHFQLAMADRIIMNKYDNIENSPEMIKHLEDRVREINSIAPMYFTKYSETSIDNLLDIHAYDSMRISDILDSNAGDGTIHDHRMGTVMLTFRPLKNEEEYNEKFIKQFLQPLLWKNFGAMTVLEGDSRDSECDWEVQRTKGLIIIEGKNPTARVIQGVRDTYDIFPGEYNEAQKECKIVLIGKYLEKVSIEKLLLRTIK
ncbi:YNR029C-like protein [Saccharomyces cerevisiae x Saccharomyces kudriavzevii VIN7]|uniref:YNR029C-like protein n=1 Tax=Saccharomyces cerevisiae x Saccharomyces kudriavzevii (strain VIN7) TaxID=1095631 RepID=H0H0I6_SACCK|nr:YNR029C-like protein [Saccharomyces cerevisiae x Saccharomyces kudriavzevii VIN7]